MRGREGHRLGCWAAPRRPAACRLHTGAGTCTNQPKYRPPRRGPRGHASFGRSERFRRRRARWRTTGGAGQSCARTPAVLQRQPGTAPGGRAARRRHRRQPTGICAAPPAPAGQEALRNRYCTALPLTGTTGRRGNGMCGCMPRVRRPPSFHIDRPCATRKTATCLRRDHQRPSVPCPTYYPDGPQVPVARTARAESGLTVAQLGSLTTTTRRPLGRGPADRRRRVLVATASSRHPPRPGPRVPVPPPWPSRPCRTGRRGAPVTRTLPPWTPPRFRNRWTCLQAPPPRLPAG